MTKKVIEVLNYSKEMDYDWFLIFGITYMLGLRSSEAVALEFDDIDWSREHVVISKSWCKKSKGFVPPKNGKMRIIPINSELKTILKEEYLKSEKKGFVLPRIQSWMNGGATKVLQRIQKKLGIKLTNYHSLRASFITHLLRDGMDIITVQAMVGHSELKTTQRYIRLDGTDLKGATNTLSLKDSSKGKVLKFSNNDTD